MNFGFTEEQQILRAEVRKYLEQRCPMEDARRIMDSAEGYCPERWKEIAELGWLGLLVPESCGGAGLAIPTPTLRSALRRRARPERSILPVSARFGVVVFSASNHVPTY